MNQEAQPGNSRLEVGGGSCIVHATQSGYWEISVIRGSASRLPKLWHHTEPHFSVPALAPSLVPKLHPSPTLDHTWCLHPKPGLRG
jgi:hypothetical protein